MSMPVRRKLGMRLPSREQLLLRLPKHSVGAEVGVWRGRFSAAIVDVVQPRVLHLIDPWEFFGNKPGSIYGGTIAQDQHDMDTIYGEVQRRFARELANGSVVLHRARSADVAAQLEDGSLDWVYIDGDHSYEGVRTDLAAFATKVRPGGLITGDDYGRGGQLAEGVGRAVDEFVAAGHASFEWRQERQYVLRTSVG
jgi:Methyltransferase domain